MMKSKVELRFSMKKKKQYIDGGNKRLGFKKGKTIGCMVVNGKRKTWKNESFEGFEKR